MFLPGDSKLTGARAEVTDDEMVAPGTKQQPPVGAVADAESTRSRLAPTSGGISSVARTTPHIGSEGFTRAAFAHHCSSFA
ncbi:unnamed protein product [Parajaminaea phylloscopi]